MTALAYEIVDVQDLNGQEVLNVYHYVDPGGTADPDALLADYVSDVISSMVLFQSTNLTHQELRYRRIYPTVNLQRSYNTGLPVSGTISAGDDEPSSTALSVKWLIGDTVALAGSATPHIKRGGTRIAGIREGYINGNGTGGGIVALVATWFGNLQAPAADGWELAVVSFLAGNRTRQSIGQAYALVEGASEPAPSTQNSRKVLRGRTS